jgi:co-chaperonin GroES (HSP10)
MTIELTDDLKRVGERVRVLRDRVLVKPVPYMHPVLATPGIEVQKGIVIAVGYGRRQRKKVPFRHSIPDGPPVTGPDGRAIQFTASQSARRDIMVEDGEETGRILPMQVKQGDLVEFSFRNTTAVDFDRVGFPGIGELLFVWQSAIYFVDNESDLEKACAETLLWQQSGGYDRHGNWMSGAEDWNRA